MRLSSYLLSVLLLIISGCSTLPGPADNTSDWSANQLYSRAKQELDNQNYEIAIDYFEKLEARFPFGQYAQQAQLETAFAYYKFEEPELAIAAADRFIKVYPRHPNIDYAWYIKGLTNYNRGKSLIERYLPQDPSQRDTFTMRRSHDDFTTLVKRYPHSIYAKDASQRIIYLRNNMAEFEVNVADYYMRRAAYVAAANRGKHVVENFQRTPAVEEALVIMIHAYHRLGLDEMADNALRVLQLNYPENPDLAWLSDPASLADVKIKSGVMGSWKPWTPDSKDNWNAASAADGTDDEEGMLERLKFWQ